MTTEADHSSLFQPVGVWICVILPVLPRYRLNAGFQKATRSGLGCTLDNASQLLIDRDRALLS
jgi:hypothetical protein